MATGIVVGVSTGVIKPLLTKLSKLMEDKFKNLKDVSKEVASLNDELTTMYAFLEMMEDADELDPLAKDWRNHVREMAYDMEDCIDDFMLRVDAGGADVKEGILRKAARRLRTLRARHQIANKIQELKSRVREASERRMRYRLDDCDTSSSSSMALDPRLTALYTESANLVGIDGPKAELAKCIMDEKPQLKVVFIIGFGGLGKTTLANQVYNQFGGEFGSKAFVSVSQRPDMIRLLDSMSSQVGTWDSSSTRDVHILINNLREYLQYKRYFVVIDDLWDSPAWDVIRCVFPKNNLKSRVIVTTRSRSLGIARCCPDECIFDMKPLSHKDSRRLFLTRIFGSEDSCPSKYNDVSNEILKRCGGLPLAIITIASLLAVKKNRLKEEWEYIRNSLSSKFGANPTLENMKNILHLSYKHLPHHLKACFLYIGIYPEDREILRCNLVQQWVTEGFVNNLRGLDALDVADSYFIELVNRSLIQPLPNTYNYNVYECRVHDLMLDFIISKCTEYNFVSLVDDSQPATTGLHNGKIRRLSVNLRHDEDGMTMPLSITSLSQVRSLAVFRGSYDRHDVRGYMHVPPLTEFKFLRMLLLEFLSEYEIQGETVVDLTGISQLFHLRYLQVKSPCAFDYSVRLPNKIQGLRQLETLEIYDTPVDSIPSDIVLLPRLAHLTISTPDCSAFPDGIGNMKSLQSLDFDLLHSSLENINGLGKLTNLRRLTLSCYKQRDEETVTAETMNALWCSIQKLDKLGSLSLNGFTGVGGDAMSSFSPSRHIEFLCLPGFMLPRVPRWFSHLLNLSNLTIDFDSMSEDDLHLIGELPSLVICDLWIGAPAEKFIIACCTGFPHLKRFKFGSDQIPDLIFEAGAMPNLRTFNLHFHSEKWDGTTPAGMEHLSSLQEIILHNSGGTRWLRSKETDVQSAFRNAIQAHPNRPKITMLAF